MTIGNDGWGRTGSPATVIDNLLKTGTYGSALPGAIAAQIPSMIRLSFSTEMLPDPKNRVQLSAKTDPVLGLPRPQFTFDIGDYVQGGLREGFATAQDLFALMEARVSPAAKPLEPGGGARMNWNTAAHIRPDRFSRGPLGPHPRCRQSVDRRLKRLSIKCNGKSDADARRSSVADGLGDPPRPALIPP
jgi:hypothetical protein